MDQENLGETVADENQKKVEMIMRQTDYTETVAREKLSLFSNNEIDVIKDYFGIKDAKKQPINSLNQEIYKQLRGHLDSAMRDYTTRVEKGEARKIN